MIQYYTILTNFIDKHRVDWIDLLAKKPYFIKVKQCPYKKADGSLKYPELYMLSYDQILSTFKEPIVRASRGCIVKVVKDEPAKMVCTPFYKFFNYGEVDNADLIDWKTAIPQEKVDGSLLKYFWYNDEWIWVTNNGWDLNVDLPISVISSFNEPETDRMTTFLDLLTYSLKSKNIALNSFKLNKSLTYMFELISPKNRIICDYPKTELILLGARDRETYQEVNAKFLQLYYPELNAFNTPKYFKETTLDTLIELNKSYKDSFHEGFVVCDKDFNRIKVKCEHYLELKGLKGEIGFTNQRVFEALLDGSIDDIVSVFPELNKQIDKIKQTYLIYTEKLKNIFEIGKNKFFELSALQIDKNMVKKKYAEWVFATHKADYKVLFLVQKNDIDLKKDFIDKQSYKDMLNYIKN